jgi:deoxyribonuclease-4
MKVTAAQTPRIGAHTPTSGGMAKRSIQYALTTEAEAIQVFASNPRGWAMPDANPAADTAFRDRAAELDIHTYVHAPFLINLGSPILWHRRLIHYNALVTLELLERSFTLVQPWM